MTLAMTRMRKDKCTQSFLLLPPLRQLIKREGEAVSGTTASIVCNAFVNILAATVSNDAANGTFVSTDVDCKGTKVQLTQGRACLGGVLAQLS